MLAGMQHSFGALLVACLLALVTPLAASAQPASPADLATGLNSIAALPSSMRDDFVSLTGQIMSARVTGDAATIANAEAIYQTQYGAMLHNADVQLQNVSAQLALNPTDSQAQAAMASAQTLVDGLVAANNVVQQFLSATG